MRDRSRVTQHPAEHAAAGWGPGFQSTIQAEHAHSAVSIPNCQALASSCNGCGRRPLPHPAGMASSHQVIKDVWHVGIFLEIIVPF